MITIPLSTGDHYSGPIAVFFPAGNELQIPMAEELVPSIATYWNPTFSMQGSSGQAPSGSRWPLHPIFFLLPLSVDERQRAYSPSSIEFTFGTGGDGWERAPSRLHEVLLTLVPLSTTPEAQEVIDRLDLGLVLDTMRLRLAERLIAGAPAVRIRVEPQPDTQESAELLVRVVYACDLVCSYREWRRVHGTLLSLLSRSEPHPHATLRLGWINGELPDLVRRALSGEDAQAWKVVADSARKAEVESILSQFPQQ